MFVILADFDFRWGARGWGACLCVWRVIFGGTAGDGCVSVWWTEGGKETEVDASKIFYLRAINADAQYFKYKLLRGWEQIVFPWCFFIRLCCDGFRFPYNVSTTTNSTYGTLHISWYRLILDRLDYSILGSMTLIFFRSCVSFFVRNHFLGEGDNSSWKERLVDVRCPATLACVVSLMKPPRAPSCPRRLPFRV